MFDQERSERPYLFGELIDPGLVIEVLSWLHQSRRKGVLSLGKLSDDHSEEQRRLIPMVNLFFDHGQLMYSSSRDPHHRLGAILLRRGDVNEIELSQTLKNAQGRRLGDALVEDGKIIREQLIDALCEQALIILHYALTPSSTLEDHGSRQDQRLPFPYFEVRLFKSEELPLALNIDIQSLLLEVLRQQDEVAALLHHLPPLHAKPIATRKPTDEDDSMVAFALQQCVGEATLNTLLFAHPIMALDALKLYLRMLSDGDLHVDLEWKPNREEPAVSDQEVSSDDSSEEWFDLNFTPDID